jgi:hypothetical protein
MPPLHAVAALVLPHVDESFCWVSLVLGVDKQMRVLLDADHHWEEHFELKCSELRSPLARFSLYRHVSCKHLLPCVFDPTIALQYAVRLSERPRPDGASFARQAFRQFFLARARLDEYFPEDDVPSARFRCLPPGPDESVPVCGGLCHVGDIPIKLVEQMAPTLVCGDLSRLAQRLEAELEPESDTESYECSECGDEHHDWDSWM